MNRPYTLSLSQISRHDAPFAGVKAANQGELLAAGFAVPDGLVLTTTAFERFMTQHGLDETASAEDVLNAPIPDDVLEALYLAAAALGDVPLAVRSSGVAEDLAGASFAGQYETVLGVRGREALHDAVARCWSSAFSRRVSAYGAERNQRGVPPMALLVQVLVEADSAGVAFTANPVTGERSEIVVSAVRGLGERLVSGLATPDEWVVRDTEVVCLHAPEDALEASDVTAVADLARLVKAHFECEQDIEWVLSAGRLQVVQSRPITALPDPPVPPVPVPADPPPGFWQRETTHAPRPLSPFIAEWQAGVNCTQNQAFRAMFAAYGMLLEGLEFREIGGWVYARAVPLGGQDRRPPPPWLMWLLVRTVPQLRARIATCRKAIRSDLHGRTIERWYDEWRPAYAAQIHQLANVELSALSDDELDTHADTVSELCDGSFRTHFLLHGAMVMVLGEFLAACRDLLGWDDQETFGLLAGLSKMSSEPARRLGDLAALAAERPAVQALLDLVGPDTAATLADVDPAFAAAFADYQTEYGCRALRYDPVDPTMRECPELVLGLIRDQIARGYDSSADTLALEQDRAAAIGRARTAAEQAGDLPRFEKALARAERCYPVREDNEFYTASVPLGLLRYVALEIGRRMAGRDQIANADDVFWLRVSEARDAFRDGQNRHELVRRRRGERASVLAHPGPGSYGTDPGPPPPFTVLPTEARFASQAMQDIMMDRILASEDSQQQQAPGDRIEGVAAAPGRYRGPARVIRDETEFGKIRPGDVLVCPITSPVWSVLFPNIGGLVTDTGGILSHAAIIAREYRLPAVVATGNATALLSDGQIITVDGDAGMVDTNENISDPKRDTVIA
ncbi:MAG: PEP-utilizing enzyme [Acidimicrobiia bacterium]|nr:PEP-utilizing enzyme [Acidimicrobiia bacterium]